MLVFLVMKLLLFKIQQITQIRSEVKNSTAKLDNYLEKSINEIEIYSEGLRIDRETLENLMKLNRQFLRENHVTEIINQRGRLKYELTTRATSKLTACPTVHNYAIAGESTSHYNASICYFDQMIFVISLLNGIQSKLLKLPTK